MSPHRILIALLALLVLSACTVQLAYTNLDRLVLRWINEQVELSSEQSQLIKQALDENLNWHCQEHLPQYVELLSDLQRDIELGRLDRARIDQYRQTISQFGDEIVAVSRPIAIELLASLDADQIEQLQQSFDKSNQMLIERLSAANPDTALAQRIDRMERRLKRFMGRLNEQQRQAIEDWAQDYQRTDGHQLAYAYQWQAQLLEALELRHDAPDAFATRIKTLFDPGAGWDDAYRQVVEFNQTLSLDMMVAVLTNSSDRQQRRLRGKMSGYAQDFDALSCSSDEQLSYLP